MQTSTLIFSQLNEINDDFTQFIKENNANEGNEEKKRYRK